MSRKRSSHPRAPSQSRNANASALLALEWLMKILAKVCPVLCEKPLLGCRLPCRRDRRLLQDRVPNQGMAADRRAAPDRVDGEEQEAPLAGRHLDHRGAARQLAPVIEQS